MNIYDLEQDLTKDLGVNGEIILEWILMRETGWEGVDWIHLTQNRDQ